MRIIAAPNFGEQRIDLFVGASTGTKISAVFDVVFDLGERPFELWGHVLDRLERQFTFVDRTTDRVFDNMSDGRVVTVGERVKIPLEPAAEFDGQDIRFFLLGFGKRFHTIIVQTMSRRCQY